MGNLYFVIFIPFYDKYIHITHNIWMNGEFVVVHHGKYRIQMHECTLFWNIDCQNFFEGAFLCQHFFCKSFNGIFMGTL